MSLFFKERGSVYLASMALLIFGLVPQLSYGLNLHALYTSACKREIGVLMDVDSYSVKLLNLSGALVQIPRYEVIYLANYPIDAHPATGQFRVKGLAMKQIMTERNGEILELVSGWPTGFTKDKISFFTNFGRELIVDRERIWSIQEVADAEVELRSTSSKRNVEFGHPYAFQSCPKEAGRKGSSEIIYPQQILSDPIAIKREFDSFEAGYAQVQRYIKEQRFYPVPLVYPTRTSLGIWQDTGGRHGFSGHRTNSLAPFLKDEYSSDIFDYQHVFVTGSSPSLYSVHEEPQTLALYAFKASYFHFAGMIDPSLILSGTNYSWQSSDLASVDDRANDVSMLEMGFDVGNWSLMLYLLDVDSVGVARHGALFSDPVAINRVGLAYRNLKFRADVSAGSGEYETSALIQNGYLKMSLARANVILDFIPRWTIRYSLIQKKIRYLDRFFYESSTLTNSFWVDYQIRPRIQTGAYASFERVEIAHGLTAGLENENKSFPKIGAFVSLSF